MNKDLHDIDKLFFSALDKNAEMPPVSVKEKLIAALDKRDPDSTRRGVIWWKRTALLFFLLLAGYILFDAGILKTGKGSGNKNFPSLPGNSADKKQTPPAGQPTGLMVVNKPAGINNTKEAGIVFNTFSGSTEKRQKGNVPAIDNLPESFSGYWGTEINRRLSYPFALTERISKHVPTVLQKPIPFNPHFTFKKSPGNIFRPYWQLTLFTSYDQTGYRLDSDDPVAIGNIKHNEVHEPSFSAGLLLTRQFTRRWSLQSGLVYSHTAIGISPQKIYAFQDPGGDISYKYITSSGYVYIKPSFGRPPAFGDSLTAESKHTLQSVHIPLMVRYTAGKNKLTVSPAVGAEAAFVSRANSEIELTDAAHHEKVFVNRLSGAKKFYVSAAASVDIHYKLSTKTSITLQPVYRHALSPITENNAVETFPRSFGIRAGFSFKF
jgi:hypothetical protein